VRCDAISPQKVGSDKRALQTASLSWIPDVCAVESADDPTHSLVPVGVSTYAPLLHDGEQCLESAEDIQDVIAEKY
jgi:hypothetical protein